MSFTRLYMYSSRVHAVEDPQARAQSTPLFLSLLAELQTDGPRRRSPLFPHLHTLSLNTSAFENNSPSEIDGLLMSSPGLLRFQISGSPSSHGLNPDDLFTLLTTRVPGVVNLTFPALSQSPITASLAAFKNLRSLDISRCTIEQNNLRICSKLPSLEELSVSVDKFNDTFPPFSGFSSLRKLSLLGSSNHMISFLTCVSSRKLKEVTLRFQNSMSGDSGSWTDVLRASNMLSALAAAALESVQMYFMHERLLHPPHTAIKNLIKPLLKARRMRTFCVVGHQCRISLNDQHLHDMAKAWPKLSQLQLSFQSTADIITINSLATLARLCPRLRILEIPSISCQIPADFSMAPPSGHRLTHLVIDEFSGGNIDVGQLAGFVDSIFPHFGPDPSRCSQNATTREMFHEVRRRRATRGWRCPSCGFDVERCACATRLDRVLQYSCPANELLSHRREFLNCVTHLCN